VPVAPVSALHAAVPFALPSIAPQSYATFMKGAEREPGVIDLVRKDDDLYLDLRPENFDTPYIILPSIASGVGGEAFAGRVYDPLVVIFKRVGKRIMWITPNTRYVADKGTAAAASLAVSVADSVIQSSAIVAEDAGKSHTILNPSIFLSDFEGIGTDLGRSVAPPPSLPGLLVLTVRPSFAVDATKSYYLTTKAFPRNDEISVNLTFSGPPNALPTVPDGRGIPIVVHYSIVAPPAHDPSYVPRYADDRVGYFITARKYFGNDVSSPPTQRFIDRWNLDAGPIVFTLTNEIPPQYRATVRRAFLAWNVAFAKLGYPGERSAGRRALRPRRCALQQRSLDHVGVARLRCDQSARERSRHGADHPRDRRDRRRVDADRPPRFRRPRPPGSAEPRRLRRPRAGRSGCIDRRHR
jgi:hypothetical protein